MAIAWRCWPDGGGNQFLLGLMRQKTKEKNVTRKVERVISTQQLLRMFVQGE